VGDACRSQSPERRFWGRQGVPAAVPVLDDLDRAILRLLQEDARRSFRRLAEMADCTAPTVAARVRRMEDLGVIQGYTVRLDPDVFGVTAGGVDVERVAHLVCHWCRKDTPEPLWAKVDGRRHPFCCTTCRGAYLERHERLSKRV